MSMLFSSGTILGMCLGILIHILSTHQSHFDIVIVQNIVEHIEGWLTEGPNSNTEGFLLVTVLCFLLYLQWEVEMS